MESFKEKPPRLKDLVNEHIMGDVWIRKKMKDLKKLE